MMDPDMKDVVNASFKPLSAATAVLVLEKVAIFIPINPQVAEVKAPQR
jgi:hypothetical protein